MLPRSSRTWGSFELVVVVERRLGVTVADVEGVAVNVVDVVVVVITITPITLEVVVIKGKSVLL